MRVGLLFPGQGAQTVGMGRALADRYTASRDVFERADAALGESLSKLCFEGPDDRLVLTENTQPAILTTSIAALEALRSEGFDVPVAAAAGHSLGEYSAHVASGTLSFEDAVRAVRQRGRFMQEAVPVGEGAMAALIGLDAGEVVSICEEVRDDRVLSPANWNSPGQVVVAGHADAVGRAIARAKAKGARRAVELPVSAPFHCALMEPAARRLARVLEAVQFQDPAFPVYANASAEPVSSADEARRLLIRQVDAPVRFVEVIEGMSSRDRVDTFVEVGPGKVLAGLVRRIARGVRVTSVSDPDSVTRAIEWIEGAEDGGSRG